MMVEIDGVMMMDDTDWEEVQLRSAVEREAALRADAAPVQGLLLTMPCLVPRPSIGSRINDRFERYRARLGSPSTRTAIIWKVARAVEEGRIEESRIESIFPRLEVVSSRGAYFLACAKGAFAAVGLSWLEEEWPDA